MTTRERRLARAERLSEWADKREVKADAAFKTADQMASVIPFGQPIMVGHYSERRDRNYRDRIGRNMDRGVESARMADSMRSRAANIEAATDHAIYDDDVDAIERLTEKLATLEAKREQRKAKNAEYRKTHKAELKAMTAYERSQAVPYASYELSNLGGTITTTRHRIARLQARKAATGTTAKPARGLSLRYAGRCVECGVELGVGTFAFYDRAERTVTCQECHTKGTEQ